MNSAFAADGVHRDDVRVMELRRGLGLLPESLQMLGVERGRKRQDLQGHAASQRQLDGLVDDAHAAPADLAHDLEVAQGICGNGVVHIPQQPAANCPTGDLPGAAA